MHTLYFVHFAITDEKKDTYRFQEKVSRGALNMAGADPETYHVWMEDWELSLQGKTHRLKAGKEGGHSWQQWSESKGGGRRLCFPLLLADADANHGGTSLAGLLI